MPAFQDSGFLALLVSEGIAQRLQGRMPLGMMGAKLALRGHY